MKEVWKEIWSGIPDKAKIWSLAAVAIFVSIIVLVSRCSGPQQVIFTQDGIEYMIDEESGEQIQLSPNTSKKCK
jgi:hypothetical protein